MAPTVDLFVYGTLMDEQRIYALAGQSFPRRKAELFGFTRLFSVQGYPFITPCPGAKTSGFVLSAVHQEALRVFDQYEDEGVLYYRRPVMVVVEGQLLSCETYIGNATALTASPAAHDGVVNESQPLKRSIS